MYRERAMRCTFLMNLLICSRLSPYIKALTQYTGLEVSADDLCLGLEVLQTFPLPDLGPSSGRHEFEQDLEQHCLQQQALDCCGFRDVGWTLATAGPEVGVGLETEQLAHFRQVGLVHGYVQRCAACTVSGVYKGATVHQVLQQIRMSPLRQPVQTCLSDMVETQCKPAVLSK